MAGAEWAEGECQGMRPVKGVGVAFCTTVKEGKPPEGLKQTHDMSSSFKKRTSIGGCVESSLQGKGKYKGSVTRLLQ